MAWASEGWRRNGKANHLPKIQKDFFQKKKKEFFPGDFYFYVYVELQNNENLH